MEAHKKFMETAFIKQALVFNKGVSHEDKYLLRKNLCSGSAILHLKFAGLLEF